MLNHHTTRKVWRNKGEKKQKEITITAEEESAHNIHLAGKNEMRKEKEKDKMNKEATSLLVVCDLENVITMPRADVGSFSYKRKLIMYNLTAITSKKQGYCIIWTEAMSGRARNNIASAFICILNKTASNDEPHINNIICWSKSCVPQNRNSHISQVILEFLSPHDKIKSMTMKYSLVWHSCMQEVDNMHKQIEEAIQVAEFYSPI